MTSHFNASMVFQIVHQAGEKMVASIPMEDSHRERLRSLRIGIIQAQPACPDELLGTITQSLGEKFSQVIQEAVHCLASTKEWEGISDELTRKLVATLNERMAEQDRDGPGDGTHANIAEKNMWLNETDLHAIHWKMNASSQQVSREEVITFCFFHELGHILHSDMKNDEDYKEGKANQWIRQLHACNRGCEEVITFFGNTFWQLPKEMFADVFSLMMMEKLGLWKKDEGCEIIAKWRSISDATFDGENFTGHELDMDLQHYTKAALLSFSENNNDPKTLPEMLDMAQSIAKQASDAFIHRMEKELKAFSKKKTTPHRLFLREWLINEGIYEPRFAHDEWREQYFPNVFPKRHAGCFLAFPLIMQPETKSITNPSRLPHA